MKPILLGFVLAGASACGNSSQPAGPTSSTASSLTTATASALDASVILPAVGDHFDPPPLRGWESKKWHDLTVQSPKYKFGRALVGLEPTEENLKRVAESQGLEYLGSDIVRFPDGTVVDCIGARHTNKAYWQYQVSH